MRLLAFQISLAQDVQEITKSCNLIVTATTSAEPLLFGDQLRPGTHVTAVGADDVGKQELDASVFDRADFIVVDSLSQCSQYGDLVHAPHALKNKPIRELGSWIEKPGKRPAHAISIADLTGIAIEDLTVAKTIFFKLQQECL